MVIRTTPTTLYADRQMMYYADRTPFPISIRLQKNMKTIPIKSKLRGTQSRCLPLIDPTGLCTNHPHHIFIWIIVEGQEALVFRSFFKSKVTRNSADSRVREATKSELGWTCVLDMKHCRRDGGGRRRVERCVLGP